MSWLSDLRVESLPATWWQGLLGGFFQSEGHQFLCCLPSPRALGIRLEWSVAIKHFF